MNNPTNLMVVEDNSRIRQALRAYLSLQPGIQVVAEAPNGLEAIILIKRQTPDIVLMDIQMPVMDGLEATRIIKKNWPEIKIIILTMYPDYQPEALSAGVDAFLVKSGSGGEIGSTVQALLQSDKWDEFHTKAGV